MYCTSVSLPSTPVVTCRRKCRAGQARLGHRWVKTRQKLPSEGWQSCSPNWGRDSSSFAEALRGCQFVCVQVRSTVSFFHFLEKQPKLVQLRGSLHKGGEARRARLFNQQVTRATKPTSVLPACFASIYAHFKPYACMYSKPPPAYCIARQPTLKFLAFCIYSTDISPALARSAHLAAPAT